MNRTQLLNQVRDTLNTAGFYVSDLCSIRPVGFDIVARRDNSLLIIKVLTNIDSMTENLSEELRTLSNLLQACPLIIGTKSGTRTLEDNALYDRFGIQVITPTTLSDHLLEGIPLEIYAGPGGLYVKLDNEKIAKLRREQNFSIGSFARELKVTRRTVQMYEGGMNASIEIAIRIEDLLGSNITNPIDILQYTPTINKPKNQEKQIKTPLYESEGFKNFQKEIFSILEKVGYKVIPVERAPFEAVSKDKNKILLTCVEQYDKKLLKKAQIISSISKITEKHAVLITDKETIKKNIEGTPLVIKKELKKTRGPEELLELILERLYNNN